MKKFGVFLLIIIILAAFNRCSKVTSLSGKYVNEQDSSTYLKFSGESTVVFCEDGEKLKGTYSIIDDAVMLTLRSGKDTALEFFSIKDKNTLIYNLYGVAYVKRTFWNYYWKRILLFGLIAYAISFIYKFIKGAKKDCNNEGMTFKEAWREATEESRAEYEKERAEDHAEYEENMKEAKEEWEKTKREVKEEWNDVKKEVKEEWKNRKGNFKEGKKEIKSDNKAAEMSLNETVNSQAAEDRVVCTNCGKMIKANAKFCGFCGKKTGKVE